MRWCLGSSQHTAWHVRGDGTGLSFPAPPPDLALGSALASGPPSSSPADCSRTCRCGSHASRPPRPLENTNYAHTNSSHHLHLRGVTPRLGSFLILSPKAQFLPV